MLFSCRVLTWYCSCWCCCCCSICSCVGVRDPLFGIFCQLPACWATCSNMGWGWALLGDGWLPLCCCCYKEVERNFIAMLGLIAKSVLQWELIFQHGHAPKQTCLIPKFLLAIELHIYLNVCGISWYKIASCISLRTIYILTALFTIFYASKGCFCYMFYSQPTSFHCC